MERVTGSCAPGYEAVKDAFTRHVLDGREDCAQVCVYVKGELKVDLCVAGANGSYSAACIQNIFSSTKVLTSLVVAMLVDRGHLRYEQKVAELWPEYAQNGKADTTLADVLRHEAGLANFDQRPSASSLTTEAIKSGALSDIVASQTAAHPPGEKRIYHAVTRGWILNEIVRRADPQGRTVGQFLDQEIAQPLGLDDEICISVPDRLLDKVEDLEKEGLCSAWCQLCCCPRCLGCGKAPVESCLLRVAMLIGLPLLMCCGCCCSSKPPVKLAEGDDEIDGILSFNCTEVRQCEVPSANGHASGRALAKIAAAIVEGGALAGGHRLLSAQGLELALGEPKHAKIFGMMDTWFSNAGWNLFKDSRLGYVGWMGLGGSAMQWHPEHRVGFGYAMNRIETTPTNERARQLQRVALQCAIQQESEGAPTSAVDIDHVIVE